MRAKIRGTELYFDVHGMGLVAEGDRMVERPVLFLLHGGPGGDHSGFKPSLSALSEVAQLVFVDHRGSGRSRSDDRTTHTLDNNVQDVAALADYLGVERFALLGSSYGGMVAQGVAIRYPRRVSNLVLCATAPSFRFITDARRWVEERGTTKQKRVCHWLWEGNFQSNEQLYEYYEVMGPLYSRSFDRETFEESWSRGTRTFEQTNLGFDGFLREFDFTDELHKIVCPTLVLAGAHDWICQPHHSELIAERVPRAQLKIFANSAHAIASDEPEAFLDVTRKFLSCPPQ